MASPGLLTGRGLRHSGPPGKQPGGEQKYAAGHWNQAGRALGPYDLTVHGPNGFYRRFAGDTSRPQPLVTVAAAPPAVKPLTDSGPCATA